MKHISVPYDNVCTIIDAEKTKISPLIQKVQIKVCYVGETPNRNGSVITREVAEEMGPTLRGCPIVGFYNKEDKDFEEHNSTFEYDEETGDFYFRDDTKPYGFVDLNANVWFQKFVDDNQNIHEYLMTEGYIWSDQYQEAKRIAREGNNQSMELDSKTLEGFWTKNEKFSKEVFIINRAIISKLCILGEDFDPCFEGAQINTNFSLNDSFKEMITELSEILNKGGNEEMNGEVNTQEVNTENNTESTVEETVVEEPVVEEPVVEEPTENVQNFSQNEGQNFENNQTKNSESNEGTEEPAQVENNDIVEDSVVERYALSEITSEMLESIPAFVEYRNATSQRIEELSQFKANIERQDKQKLIDSFYMLSDEDKKPFNDEIDKYSYHELEGELSILCVRNKVNFNLDEDKAAESEPVVYNLNEVDNDDAPEWIKAAREVSKNM